MFGLTLLVSASIISTGIASPLVRTFHEASKSPAAPGNTTSLKPPKAPSSLPHVTELATCVPPSIRVTVDSSQFSIPLFTDCTYQTTTLLTPGQNSAPSTAISSSADYGRFVDSNGATLDTNSLNQFLLFFGDSVNTATLLAASACGITDTNNIIDTIQDVNEQLNGGQSINVLNFQCIVEIS